MYSGYSMHSGYPRTNFKRPVKLKSAKKTKNKLQLGGRPKSKKLESFLFRKEGELLLHESHFSLRNLISCCHLHKLVLFMTCLIIVFSQQTICRKQGLDHDSKRNRNKFSGMLQ